MTLFVWFKISKYIDANVDIEIITKIAHKKKDYNLFAHGRHGYKLYGERSTFCNGNSWSHKALPACVSESTQSADFDLISVIVHCMPRLFLHMKMTMFPYVTHISYIFILKRILMVIIVEITCDSGSSCDETGRMVVPYGEARALLGGGEDRHHYADSDHDDFDDFDDFDDRYDFFQLCTSTAATLAWRWTDLIRYSHFESSLPQQ